MKGIDNINRIYNRILETRQQTGLSSYSKQDFLDSKRYLIKGGPIVIKPDYNHGQKEVLELASLGVELVNVIHSIDRYHKSFSLLSTEIVTCGISESL